MNTCKVPLALVVTMTMAFSPWSVFADETKPSAIVSAQQASGSIVGKVAFPDERPDWFKGGDLDVTKIVVVIEGKIKRPPLPTPDGFKQMSQKEQQAWQEEFRKSEAYGAYQKSIQEATKNPLVYQPVVQSDGSYRVENLPDNHYSIAAMLPHALSELNDQASAWAFAYSICDLKDGAQADLGKLELNLQNVVMPGDVAPDWTARTYDGGKIKLSDFRGKCVLMDFWATWCGPCKEEIPNLEAAYKDFGGEKFEIIGLSLDNNIDLPKKFHAAKPSPYTQAYLGKWQKTETSSRDYGVRAIPSVWLIGPDGKVIARGLRGQQLRKAVQKAVQAEGQTS